MKSSNEITQMLLEELLSNIDNTTNFKNSTYYNEILGDTSFLLAGLLNSIFKKESDGDENVWIDDSLITAIKLIDNKIFIDGVMIWGKGGTTEQWVEPFKFIMNLDKSLKNFTSYKFFFKDLDLKEISYEDFRENRDYYSHEIKNWKYEFNSKY